MAIMSKRAKEEASLRRGDLEARGESRGKTTVLRCSTTAGANLPEHTARIVHKCRNRFPESFMYSSGNTLHPLYRGLSHPSCVNCQGCHTSSCLSTGGCSSYTCECRATMPLTANDLARASKNQKTYRCCPCAQGRRLLAFTSDYGAMSIKNRFPETRQTTAFVPKHANI